MKTEQEQITEQTGIREKQIYCTENQEDVETAHEEGKKYSKGGKE